MGKYKRYLVLSDVHVPYEDKPAIDAVCAFARDYKPDGLILNGDILELDEVSRHTSGSVAQLEGKRIARTFAAGNALLDKLDAAVGKGCREKHFIDGNHEHRLARWIASGDNAVFAGDDSLCLKNRLRLSERGYKHHDNYPEAYVKLGHLIVTHGQWSGGNAAKKHLDRYQTSVLVGHTHVPGVYYGSTFTGQRVGYCAGFLADPKSDAMKYAPKPKAWRTGFASIVVEQGSGNFWVELHNFVEGVFFVGPKAYGKKAA